MGFNMYVSVYTTLENIRKFSKLENIESCNRNFVKPTSTELDRLFREGNPYDKRVCNEDYRGKTKTITFRDIVDPSRVISVKDEVGCKLFMLAKQKKLRDLCNALAGAPDETNVEISLNCVDLSLTLSASYNNLTYQVTDTNSCFTVSKRESK